MTFSEKSLARQAVNDTGETVYTVASGISIVRDIQMCNTGTTTCHVSIWLVPNGGSASNENVLISQWDIPRNDFAHWAGWQVLDTVGDTIEAQSEINDKITLIISGAEIT